ncbi:uncharacterized protein MYCFIDRAFT_65345 [Pseudocercospora fijiensis CIRAD86]|uniref:Uncharacterized protein n=1 Tax=Pseudocercospora fijiensis (strain CIRAD86) TaxID=383855 RepID=M3ANU9_PSEFD|nr:uncharacterized protein MYCFIDRAFT_65345 [Pseudocercospora fijiensis CIRAD86]EME78778.1 hypothetical protein MYCFIDRAFT_65345 [Pseudocercospora fijiensis CIRAD86]
MLRDQFEIKTWLALGATFQGLAFVVFGLWSFIPASLYLLYSLADAYLIILGWKSNPYTRDNIQKKFSAQIPDELGNYGNKPANSDIVVFLIGTRCNHPLGILAPGFKELGGYFQSMTEDLETHAEEFGFLGMTSWLNSSDRTTKSELLEVCYFRSIERLHAFAHSNFHREGWNWWNKTIKEHGHLSIWHETYHVPAKHWESIYVNSHPSGINSTTYKITDKETGESRWASPVVDASKGLLKTSAGRMSRSQGEEHEKYGRDPY